MNIQSFKTIFLFLIFSSSLIAQNCPPPGFPEPGNTCPEAPILCPDLDGYCATINNNNVPQNFPCCNNGWILNNDEWFAFFAGTTSITIEIVPQNCTDGNMKGLQGGIYDGCPLNGGCNAMDVQCACIEDPFILSSNSDVVGQVYWIVLDGCSGNVCDYTINVLAGSTVGFAPANPGAIVGPDVVCQGFSSAYAVPPSNGATMYQWTLDPSDAGSLSLDNDSTVTVEWSNVFSGPAKLCVSGANLCYQSALESCFDIVVESTVNLAENIALCPGETVTISGVLYAQDTTFSIEIPGTSGCDTLRTYKIETLPYQTRAETIGFCSGGSVTIDGQVYDQAGIVIDTIAAAIGCDTIVTYTLTLLPYQTRSESISFCPGESVTIDGQLYNQSGIVIDTISSTSGCDTIVTYTLTLLTQPTRSETIAFCPGETITLGGTNYTQPGIVALTIPSTNGGCDTIETYTLQFLTPTSSNLSISCPNSITIETTGSSGAVANYNLPQTLSDCICPGIQNSLSSGLASRSNFPLGLNTVCYTAKDSCGQTASCCFNVTVDQEDEVCDTKAAGCMKYELLSITEDLGKNRTYRIRLTNNCANKLIYTAIQLPAGMVAIEPANGSIYTAPSGNTYLVRNPNFSPQYSIRYSSISDSINNGESDIFKYTLPAQANVTFIHVVSRLAPSVYIEAHLNTFYCPIGVTPAGNRPSEERDPAAVLTNTKYAGLSRQLQLYPNPANQFVRAETGGQAGELILQDAFGRVVRRQSVENAITEFSVEGLPQGLYQVIFVGEKTTMQGSLVVHH